MAREFMIDPTVPHRFVKHLNVSTITYSLHCSSFLGLPVRILNIDLVKPKKGTTMETIGNFSKMLQTPATLHRDEDGTIAWGFAVPRFPGSAVAMQGTGDHRYILIGSGFRV